MSIPTGKFNFNAKGNKRVFCKTCGTMNIISKQSKKYICKHCDEEFIYSKALSYRDKKRGYNTVYQASIYKWCVLRSTRKTRKRPYTVTIKRTL